MKRLITVVLLTIGGLAPRAYGATVSATGDVIVLGSALNTPNPSSGQALVFDSQGNLRGPVVSRVNEFFAGPSFLSNRPEFVAVATGFIGQMVHFDGSGNVVATSSTFGGQPSRTTVDSSENVYIGFGTAHSIFKLSSSANYIGQTALGTDYANALDLAADQCTLYYVDSFAGRLGRVDVCSGSLLPPLATVPTLSSDLRILTDGTILVAAGESLLRISSNGAVARNYSIGANVQLASIALDVDAQSVWISSSIGLVKMNLDSGAIVAGPFATNLYQVYGMAVYGEPRAALVPPSIPALLPLSQILLASLLILVGVHTVARRT